MFLKTIDPEGDKSPVALYEANLLSDHRELIKPKTRPKKITRQKGSKNHNV
jgi:hypothetical protein